MRARLVLLGGGLGESSDPASFSLSIQDTTYRCSLHPGESLVMRAISILDDGRTLLSLKGCP